VSSGLAIGRSAGHVDLTASGTAALCPDPTVAGCGFIQAWTVRLSGAQKNFQGLGPGVAGPPTVTTTTTTYPGTTVAGTTSAIKIPGITTPGTTTVTPPVTSTTGTCSNLDE
jgi:hypothetical protein